MGSEVGWLMIRPRNSGINQASIFRYLVVRVAGLR
jgi:hypothetical protein